MPLLETVIRVALAVPQFVQAMITEAVPSASTPMHSQKKNRGLEQH